MPNQNICCSLTNVQNANTNYFQHLLTLRCILQTTNFLFLFLDCTTTGNDKEIHFRIYESTSGTDGPSVADVSRSQANLISPSSHGGVDWSDVDLTDPMDNSPVPGDYKQEIPPNDPHPCKHMNFILIGIRVCFVVSLLSSVRFL